MTHLVSSLLLTYFLLIWVLIRLVVPNIGFSKSAIPEKIPAQLQKEIDTLSTQAKDDRDFLRLVYEHVTERYVGNRLKTVGRFWEAFRDPLTAPPGFLHCMSQNHVIRVMLVKSGRFTDSNITIKIVPINFFIHQYLVVHVDGESIIVDPWSSFLGVPLGERTFLFG